MIHFIHNLFNETEARGLSLTSRPRKAATVYLTKAALESCIPGDIVETGTYTGGDICNDYEDTHAFG